MKPRAPKILTPTRDRDAPYGTSYVYLIGLAGGEIKVGVTTAPNRRMSEHRRAYKDSMQWVHFFAPVRSRAYITERQAIANLAKDGQRIGDTERFTGICKGRAIACVRAAMPFLYATPEPARAV